MGGLKCAANILNFVDRSAEAKISEVISEHDPELAGRIQDLMFTFDNLSEVDDRGIQTLLREVSSDNLVLALKGADENIKGKIFKNMSTRAAEMLKEDLESRGPVKVSDVESEQKEILKAVRRLAEDGQISLGGKSDDAYI
jgi:flagellar motor switch protein FliG